jgi:non-heme chloroperoxidase
MTMNRTPPVLFVHGLWVHSTAWNPWLELFREHGYQAHAPGWPGDSDTVEATRHNPEAMSGVGIQQVTDHYAAIAASLPERPIIIGHSFGGLIAQKLLAAGAASAAIAVDPAPIKGVAALPLAQIRSALPVLRKKSNAGTTVTLTRRQFRYGFGNALTRAESDSLYSRFSIPGPGRPVFELTGAKKDPATPTAVTLDDSDRGPLLVIGGTRDHTIPEVVARQAANLYRPGLATQYVRAAGRGHSLVFDAGWRTVADEALAWLTNHHRPTRNTH